MFKMNTGYYLELLTPETIRLFESTNIKLDKNENWKNDRNFEVSKIPEVVLVHCNIVNNNYQRNSRVFYTFVLNKSFSQLLHISSNYFMFLKKFNSELYIEVWLTDKNSNFLEIEDKTSITLVVN